MKAANRLPLDLYISQDALLDDLLYELQQSNSPKLKIRYNDNGTIKLNKKSLKAILSILRRCLLYYLRDCDILDNGRIEVELFPGFRFYAYDEEGKTITNKLTGNRMYQEPRRRFGAYFIRYYQRKMNGLNRKRTLLY